MEKKPDEMERLLKDVPQEFKLPVGMKTVLKNETLIWRHPVNLSPN